MIRVKATLTTSPYGVIIVLPLENSYYEKFKDHIDKNMFFAVKKLAEKYKELLFCSVGDHLSKDDQQNYIKADISVAAKFGQSITPEIIKELDDQTRWIVQLDCLTDRNCYLFIIDKETQFITARSIIQK